MEAVNNKNTESEATAKEIFSPPVNEPPTPVYNPAFSPLEDSEDEALAEQAVTTHTTMEVKTIDSLNTTHSQWILLWLHRTYSTYHVPT